MYRGAKICPVNDDIIIHMSAGGRRLARVAGARGRSSSVMVATAAACPRGPPERKIAPRPAQPTRYDRAAARDGGRNDPARRRSSAGARTRAFRLQQRARIARSAGGVSAHVWPCVCRLARLDALRAPFSRPMRASSSFHTVRAAHADHHLLHAAASRTRAAACGDGRVHQPRAARRRSRRPP